MKLPKRPRGIVLISVIFLSILIAMYISAAFALSRGQLLTTRQSSENELAELAAKSGIQYALARLEEDINWRGDGNNITVNTSDLTVVENNGNVVGLLTFLDGGKAQFRLRFNYQDGPAGPDGLDDPPADMLINNPHVSLSRLVPDSRPPNFPLPLGDGSGYSVDGNDTGYSVQPGVVALVCEGRVSPELKDANSTNPNPPLEQVLATRVVEEFHKVVEVNGQKVVDPALSMAAKKTRINLFDGDATQEALLNLSDSTGEGQPKLRTRDGFEVRNEDGTLGGVDGEDSKILVLDPTDPDQLQANLHPGVSGGEEDPAVAFYELTWDQVESASSTTASLKAGTYVYWASDDSLHYYPKNHEKYMVDIVNNPTDPGQVVTDLPDGLSFVKPGETGPDGVTSDKIRLVVTGDVNVEQEGDAVDFSFLPRSGAKENIDDNKLALAGGGGGGAGGGGGGTVDWGTEFSGFPPYDPGNPTVARNQMETWVNAHFTSTGATPQGLEFLREFAPYGEFTSSSNKVSWDDAGLVDANNVKDAVRHTVLLNDGEIKNIDETQKNDTILPLPDQTQNVQFEKVYNYFMELSAAGGGGPTALTAELTEDAVSDKIGELDLEDLSGGAVTNSSEPHTPADFEVTFAPQSDDGIRITSPGDIRIAADVRGNGASLKAKGQIRMIGVGFDLASNANEEGPSISLYAQDDIAISTLRKQPNGDYAYEGLDFKGIIYSWSNVLLSAGHPDELPGVNPQKVRIQGTIVAYGGEPGVQEPGEAGGGNLYIAGDQVNLIFDPAYLVGVTGGTGLRARLGLISSSTR